MELGILFGYLLLLLVVGLFSRSRAGQGIHDYYLASGSLGFAALFFTFYATQYSGNTLLGYAGAAYRHGLYPFALIFGFLGIVGVYHLFATKLNQLAREHRFITLSDYLRWRFNSEPLAQVLNVLAALALLSYIFGNFKALGILLESMSGGVFSQTTGVMFLALIMALYGWLGGMRAVAWTDILQGATMLVATLLLSALFVFHFPGGQAQAFEALASEFKASAFDVQDWLAFGSLIVLTSFGAAMYPQAIQRIYSASGAPSLRRTFRWMLLMPFLTALPVLLIGLLSREILIGLNPADSEKLIVIVLRSMSTQDWLLAALVPAYACAALAAVMSTLDSSLLTLSSMLMRDTPLRNRWNNAHSNTLLSRSLTFVLVISCAVLALLLPKTIWALLVFKLELLIQLAPALILGVRTRIGSQPVLYGAVIGCGVLFGLKLAHVENWISNETLWRIDVGLWAFAANLLVLYVFSLLATSSAKRAPQLPSSSRR